MSMKLILEDSDQKVNEEYYQADDQASSDEESEYVQSPDILKLKNERTSASEDPV